jgi:peroxiredoxin
MVKVKVGDKAPDFTLQSNTGENITLSQFFGKKMLSYSSIPETKDLLASKKQKPSEISTKSSKKGTRKSLA